jgi:S-adenosylmethionine:tRNA ribosyltransferase-isomerase
MQLSEYEYDLPAQLIAQAPADPRDSCRLLALDPALGSVSHHVFREFPTLLRPGDCLVVNDTRVMPARLIGVVAGASRQAEIMLLRQLGEALCWEAMLRPGRQLRPGSAVEFPEDDGRTDVRATVETKRDDGRAEIRFCGIGPDELRGWLWRRGQMPLPPYIHASGGDAEAYQTVYSRVEGSVAAPTAGLHFTPSLLRALAARHVGVVPILLHVGYGTFAPLRDERVEGNRMEGEYYEVSAAAASEINRRRAAGGRIFAVGTTVTRTLESVAAPDGTVAAASGLSELFIYPGFRWKCVDGLLTNFHLPRSSTLLLAAAKGGRELVLCAYRAAVALEYRFYSFGDAMLILPGGPAGRQETLA